MLATYLCELVIELEYNALVLSIAETIVGFMELWMATRRARPHTERAISKPPSHFRVYQGARGPTVHKQPIPSFPWPQTDRPVCVVTVGGQDGPFRLEFSANAFRLEVGDKIVAAAVRRALKKHGFSAVEEALMFLRGGTPASLLKDPRALHWHCTKLVAAHPLG